MHVKKMSPKSMPPRKVSVRQLPSDPVYLRQNGMLRPLDNVKVEVVMVDERKYR